MKSLYAVIYHFENVPKFMQKIMQTEFMKHRNEVVDVFNDHIDEVNTKWDSIGKPAAFGEYTEDINPKYVDHIRKYIQPEINVLNERFPICKYCIDDIGNIVGYLTWIRNSKIYFTLEEIES